MKLTDTDTAIIGKSLGEKDRNRSLYDNFLSAEICALTWLTYRQAAFYTGWTVAYLRNLVSAGQIPVYGKQRVRRFRRDMLDLFLTNPDVAMRKFRLERNTHGN